MMLSRWVAATLIAATVAATGCGAAANTSSQAATQVQDASEKPARARAAYTTMSAQELQAEMDAGQKAVIVDLREPELYRAGHIPGAANIPFEQFGKRLSELSPEGNIVLVCHTGPMGDVSGTLLAEKGYAHVRNLRGGMAAWRGELVK